MSKAGQLKSFGDNLKITLRLDCSLCTSETFEREYEVGDVDDFEKTKNEFSNEAHKAGWRESESKVFGQIGIHCKFCHANRNNRKYFNE